MAYELLSKAEQAAADTMMDAMESAEGNEAKEPGDLQATVKRSVEGALNWREANLDDLLADATSYYQGKPFGNEKKGRSQIVMTVVRDAVDSVIPCLNRIFFGSDRVVEFAPFGPEDVQIAAQQTDFINYKVIQQDNKGFLILNAAWKDALIRKLGVVTWWWEEKERTEGYDYSGAPAEALALLANEEGVTIESQEEDGVDPATGQPTFKAYIKRTFTKGCARFDAVPPEEFVWSPNARSLEDAPMVGTVRAVPADELVAMGVPKELVDEQKGNSRIVGETLQQARSVDDQSSTDRGEDEQDSATRRVLYCNIYIKYDKDGDGKTEILRVQTIGDDFEVWKDECVDEKPFALFRIDPEPHTILGTDLADRTKDLQLLTSATVRGMLDSLGAHLNPPTEVLEGAVNMKDLLNPEVNRIVRVRQTGAMREIPTSFVGREALPVLQWLDGIEERRTGRKNGAMGIDAETLQSSTRAAVSATVSAAQQRVEQYARMFAETGMVDLFRGLYRLTARHAQGPEMVRLRGDFIQMDPRSWEADRDVIVNVGLGAAPQEERVAFLTQMLAGQQAAYEKGIPLVGIVQMRNTLAKIMEASGYRDVGEFWKPFTPEQEAEYEQQKAQQKPQPTPDVVLTAEITREQIKATTMTKLVELRLKAEDMRLKNDRDRDKITRDFIAAMSKIGVTIDGQKIEQARLQMDQDAAATDILSMIGQQIDTAIAGQAPPEQPAV